MLKRLKRGSKLLLEEKRFKREFQRQIRMVITITLGFTIAFTWRQTAFDISLNLISFITRLENNSVSSILASILITAICFGLIYFSSKFLRDGLDNF